MGCVPLSLLGVALKHEANGVDTLCVTPQPCYLSPPPTPFCLFPVRVFILFCLCGDWARVQASLYSSSLHYSLKMGCHQPWSPLPTAAGGGALCHVAYLPACYLTS